MSEEVQSGATENKAVLLGGVEHGSDPTGAKGTDAPISTGADPSRPSPEPQRPLYTGLTGEIKTNEEWSAYTKNLENTLIQARATSIVTPAPAITPPPPAGPTAKERFSELIFSKPEEAFEIAVNEAQARSDARNNKDKEAQRQKEMFWNDFYKKHADLNNVKDTVELIVAAKMPEISQMKNNDQVSEFLSKETRRQIDLVKSQTGFRETVVPSGNAVTLGGSGEPIVRATPPPAAPKTFAEQIRMIRPKGQVKR